MGNALKSQDLDLCAAAGSQGCADMVAAFTLPRCVVYGGEARTDCELAVATRLKSVKICRSTRDPDGCLAAVAAETNDINVVLAAARDAEHRDKLLSRYAQMAGDESALAQISDPILANKTAVMMVPVMARKPNYTISMDWCLNMRRLPDAVDSGDTVGATLSFCRYAVTLAERAAAMENTAETDNEREQVAQAFASALEAMVASGRSSEEIADALDPGSSGPFGGAWACPARGILRLVINPADNSVQGSVSGKPGEHWGGGQRDGGSITGTINGRSLQLRMASGDGTVSNLTAELSEDGSSFSGGWTWMRNDTQLGTGTWNCSRSR
jgi:hypothetical protein